MNVLSLEYMPVVRVNAPELFEDPDFLRWLNDPTRNQATWHRKGEAPGEYSDVFMTAEFPHCGSDSDMPPHCWEQLVTAIQAAGQPDEEIVIWIANL